MSETGNKSHVRKCDEQEVRLLGLQRWHFDQHEAWIMVDDDAFTMWPLTRYLKTYYETGDRFPFHNWFLARAGITLRDGKWFKGAVCIGTDARVYNVELFAALGKSCGVPLQDALRTRGVLEGLCKFASKRVFGIKYRPRMEKEIFPMEVVVRVPCLNLHFEQVICFPYLEGRSKTKYRSKDYGIVSLRKSEGGG